jgi:hypothetical protein
MNSRLLLAFFLLVACFLTAVPAQAQEGDAPTAEAKEKPQPARKAFESAVLIDQQTDVVNSAKTLEWNIQHRFGPVSNGSKDLYGIFAPSNIRLGFSYTPIDRVGVGFGLSKINVTNPFLDFNAKVKLLEQARSGGSPVNVTAFGSASIDTRDGSNFADRLHRLAYFAQVIVSRRVSSKLSAQASFMMSHHNAVDSLYKNDVFGFGLAARYKISSQSSLLLEWTQPLTQHPINDAPAGIQRDAGPNMNLAVGMEVATSSHAFQFFLGACRDLLPQYNLSFNTSSWTTDVNGSNKLSFVAGFNMTRLWNF